MNQRESLLTETPEKLFMKLSIPGIIGMMIVGLYNLVDAIFVGQLIGKAAVGAVALMFSVVVFNQGILTLIGSGSMSILSIAIGKKDQTTINKLLGNLIVILFIFSGLLSIIVYFNVDTIVKFIGGKGITYTLGVKYLRILLIGFIPAAIGPAMNFLVRAEGKMKDAMLIAGGAGILNIILDPIFIKTLDLGIKGAAIATIISQTLYMIIQFVYFGTNRSVINLKKMKLKVAKDLLPQILKVGSSQMIMCIMYTIQQIILFRVLQSYGGNDQVSLMGATYKFFVFSFYAMWGIGQGLQSVVGINFGAKKYTRVKLLFKKFNLIGFSISSFIWILSMVFPQTILGWFIKDSTLVYQNINLFRLFMSLFFSYIYLATVMYLFIGLGKGKEACKITTARQIVFFVPIVLLLPKIIGLKGVWLAIPLADLFSMILGLFYQKRVFKNDLNK